MTQSSQLHVTEWGTGPRVVLIHGGTPGGGAMAFVAQRELEARWQLVLPDRPGHGQSLRQGREDFERDATLLAPLLNEGSHLVGHSYGGMVALCMAVADPGAICSLTLIEPPAYSFGLGNPAVDDMARVNRDLFENPPADPMEMMQLFFGHVGIDMELPDPVPEAFLPIAQAFADDFGNIRAPDEAHFEASSIAAGGYPILVLTSGRIAGFEAIAGAIAAQTGAEHVTVPGTDHAVQNAGDRVNPLLEKFWIAAQEGHKAFKADELGKTIGKVHDGNPRVPTVD
jgi:pimeloyl-ACP methyl ester carboxylesterase